MFMVGSGLSFDYLKLVTFHVAETDDPASAAHRGDRLEEKFYADRLQLRVCRIKVRNPQGQMAQSRLKPRLLHGIGSGVLYRHQFDHRTAIHAGIISHQQTRRFLAIVRDQAHAQVLAIPIRHLPHVVAGNRRVIDAGKEWGAHAHLALLASAAASTNLAGLSSLITSSQIPYFTASAAPKNRSRSLSSRIRSVDCPVHLAMTLMRVSLVLRISSA